MTASIGIIDSGVGGITVLQALEVLLPHEDVLYFCDNANFPYGEKTGPEIVRCLSKATAFLLTKNIKLLIIACHTASVYGLKHIQDIFPIPIIGMVEPTVDTLLQTDSKGRIAIMATEATIRSNVYQDAIHQALPYSTLFPLPCPKLAEKIETGADDTQKVIKSYVESIQEKNIDTLVLACTHYAHLRHAIEEELPPKTVVINPAMSAAHAAESALKERNPETHISRHDFFVTGDIKPFGQFLEKHPLKSDYEIQNF